MDFTVVDNLAEHRAFAAEWADRNIDPSWPDEQYRTGKYHTKPLHEKLAADGWLGAGWPEEYGGTGNDPGRARAIVEEVQSRGLHMDGWSTTQMICRTLLQVGTEEQKRDIIPRALAGEVIIVLGYTEPDSGSDAAAAKMRAVRDGDDWVIDGQKMFTSTADQSTHIFLLTRTNPDVPKHKGLTMFLVETSTPGIDMHPIHTLGGQLTNATFYSDVRVPDSTRVGGVDEGWSVMHVALVYERGGGGGGTGGPTLPERVARWAQSTSNEDGSPVYDDPAVRERLAWMATEQEVSRLLNMRTAWVAETGGLPGTEGSTAKLFSSEAAQRHHWDLLDILGPEAVLSPDAPGAPLEGMVEHSFRYGVVGTIYGGASEIMREIVAERTLGLPRNRPSR